MKCKETSVEDVCGTQALVGSDSAASCKISLPTPTGNSTLDDVLLNVISTRAPKHVEFPPVADLSEHATILDVHILEFDVGSPLYIIARARYHNYEHNRHFQDWWATLLPWDKAIVGGDGRVSQV